MFKYIFIDDNSFIFCVFYYNVNIFMGMFWCSNNLDIFVINVIGCFFVKVFWWIDVNIMFLQNIMRYYENGVGKQV